MRASRLLAVALAAMALAPACSSSTSRSTASSSGTSSSASATSSSEHATAAAGALTLDPAHDYGNKYADGVLPVGDNKYTTDAAKQGFVFLCHTGGPNAGGAQTRGPWFSADGTTYDINKKTAVQGAVEWDGSLTVNVANEQRTIVTNDVPNDHTTGVFPVAPDDPAYAIDRNPNSIKEQSVTYTLTANPTVDSTPHCMSG